MRRLAAIALPTVLTLAASASAGDAPAPAPAAPAAPAAPRTDPSDPAVLRRALLATLDAQIDVAAAKAHLDARLALDAAAPIPYLGVDADPEGGAMRVTHVYPDTAAEAAGIAVGDLLLAVHGDAVDSPAALGRAIRRGRPGDATALRYRHGDETRDATVPLGRRPEEDEDEDEQFPGLAGPSPAPPAARRLDFETDAAGALPAGFEAVLGGHGAPPKYVVVSEGAARFLRQDEGDATGIRFPMALLRDFDASDVEMKVRFRFAGGRVDRAAGLVLRYRDPAHYLVARANAVEGDLRIFRVAGGLRRTLPGARVVVKIDDDRWHVLTVRAQAERITASCDGTSATGYDTYFLHGRVGVWTKSDSRTDFDDLEAAPLPAPPAK